MLQGAELTFTFGIGGQRAPGSSRLWCRRPRRRKGRRRWEGAFERAQAQARPRRSTPRESVLADVLQPTTPHAVAVT